MEMSDRIAEIRARLEAATPGPWKATRDAVETASGEVIARIADDSDFRYLRCQGHSLLPDGTLDDCNCDLGVEDDANLIAHAPDDIRFLLNEVHRMREMLADNEHGIEWDKCKRLFPVHAAQDWGLNGALGYWCDDPDGGAVCPECHAVEQKEANNE
jgi:hypothetical protein